MQKLDIPTVCERIAVQPPYFAFNELEEQNIASVRGIFAAEQQMGYERGPVASAEIGRHLAILGSCAAVVEPSGERTYYLATKARLKMLPGARYSENAETFQAVAEVIHQDRRSLAIQAVALDDGPFALLRCEYQVLSSSVFSRVFKDYRTEPIVASSSSPYKEPIALDFEAPRNRSLIAHSRPLSADRFAGHFLEYPTWPVAILADTISQVRSRLLHFTLDDEVDYTVIRVDVDAFRLVPASESLSFHVECVSASYALSHYIFSAKVLWGETIAATMEMEVYV